VPVPMPVYWHFTLARFFTSLILKDILHHHSNSFTITSKAPTGTYWNAVSAEVLCIPGATGPV
jgi:hypothetical protein